MAAFVDPRRYGACVPGPLDRLVIAATSALPDSWLGLRLAIALRRIVTMRLGHGGLDVMRWGMRVRLYPLGNGCEKNALFTPQMYDVVERAVVAEAIAQARAANRPFVFVDIGANVGLYSLYAASAAGPEAKILAFEPQPGIADRLSFNVASNPGAAIALHRIALSDREGTVRLVINNSDSGGTHVAKDGQVAPSAEAVEVACRPLATVLAEAGVAAIDVLKIDVEGAEDIVLGSFLRDQPHAILPRLIIIEDTSAVWNLDLFGLMEKRGYQRTGRSRHNIVWAMSPEAPV